MPRKTNKEIELTPIEFPEIHSFIHFFIEPNRDRAAKFLKERYGMEEYYATGDGVTLSWPDKDPVVWLKHKRPDTVAHEMLHAVLHMLDNIGLPRHKSHDEILCYYLDYAVSSVIKC